MKTYPEGFQLELEMQGRGESTPAQMREHSPEILSAESIKGTLTGVEYILACGHRVQVFGRKPWRYRHMVCRECIDEAETIPHVSAAAGEIREELDYEREN
jgi:hypothetical protein